MNQKKSKEIETIQFFMPPCMKHIPISSQDMHMFFEWSEQGKHKDKIGSFPYPMDGFNALVQGKIWRGRHMEMWEQSILEGTTPYYELISSIPKSVVEFIQKELFKGTHATHIQSIYETIQSKRS